MIGRRRWLGLALAATTAPAVAQAQAPLVVFAAASLKNALDEIAADWARQAGRPMPRISYAASSTLAKQMEQGAPADLFVSADLDWMDYAQGKGLVRPDSRINLLGNRIVLVVPKDSALTAVPITAEGLSRALAGGKLATGNVDSVPAGKYGRATLEKLGAWNAVRGSIAQAESVRAALLLVSRGEAPVGLVYATDAAADPGVRVVASFPPDSHPPIVYPAALAKDSTNADGRAFLDFLRGAAARAIFEKQGFTVMARAGAATSAAA
jgi:molybdate transport system substrate-binding protein